MVLYDGIIENLQNFGGVSNVFKNLINHMPHDKFTYYTFDKPSTIVKANNIVIPSRVGERYRAATIECQEDSVFHSTYYRIPQSNGQIKIVTTVHDYVYEKYVKGIKRRVHSWQKQKAIDNSNIVVCVSNSTADDCIRFSNVSHSKVIVIPNACSGLYKYQKREANKDVVFVGSRASVYKNFELAVRSVALVEGLRLNIVGGGDLTLAELKLLKMILKDRFIFTPWISEKQFCEILNRSYCLIYPSSYEGFGIPILEAFSSGCPVVIGDTPACVEVAGKAALIAETYSTQCFSKCLKAVEYGRKELISRGLERAKHYDWKKSSSLLQEIYKSLV